MFSGLLHSDEKGQSTAVCNIIANLTDTMLSKKP